MRYENNTTAVTAVIAPTETEATMKIQYLMDRAQNVYYDRDRSLTGLFHLSGPQEPRYYKDVIEAIKNDEFEINEEESEEADKYWKDYSSNKKGWYDFGAFYGINFTKFPKADYDGYNKARAELIAEYQKVKDIIAIMPAEKALKAVQDFEKWTPSNAPTK